MFTMRLAWLAQRSAMRAFLTCAFCCAISVAANAASALPVPDPQGKANPDQGQSDQPLWQADLRPLGFPAGDPVLQSQRGLDVFNTTDFLGDGVVVTTFLTQAPQAQALPNAPPVPRPYRLDAVFFDASSGKVLKQLEWQTAFPDAGIFPRYGGGFIFFSTERFVLYSADFLLVKELPLSRFNTPGSGLVGIAGSPDGKTLVLRLHQRNVLSCFRVFTETLTFSQFPCEEDAAFSVSDDAVAELAAGTHGSGNSSPANYRLQLDSPDLKGIFIHEAEKPARSLCSTSKKVNPCLLPQFVSNDALVVYSPTALQVMTVAGAVKFTEKYDVSKNWYEPGRQPVRPAAAGERFGVSFNKTVLAYSGYNPTYGAYNPSNTTVAEGSTVSASILDRVDIFDLKENRWVFSLKNKKNQFGQIWGFALSPAGDRIAIDSGGTILMYSVP
jgi:hypothetical protein